MQGFKLHVPGKETGCLREISDLKSGAESAPATPCIIWDVACCPKVPESWLEEGLTDQK